MHHGVHLLAERLVFGLRFGKDGALPDGWRYLARDIGKTGLWLGVGTRDRGRTGTQGQREPRDE